MRGKPARGLFRAEWRRAYRSWIWFAVPLLIFGIMALEILSDFPDAQTRRQYIMSNVGYYCFGINFGSIVIALPVVFFGVAIRKYYVKGLTQGGLAGD